MVIVASGIAGGRTPKMSNDVVAQDGGHTQILKG